MRTVRRPALWLFLLVLGAYGYFYQAGGWNQNSRLDLTRALVERGTVVIDGYEKNTGDLARKDEHYYCDKAPVMSYAAVPAYAAGRLIAGHDLAGNGLGWMAWLCTLLVVGVPSALAVLMMSRLAARTGLGAGLALGTGLAWGLGTLAWPYATLFYGHQLSAALLLVAFVLLVDLRRGAGRPWHAWLAGGLLGTAVGVEYPSLLPGLAIGGYALGTLGWRRAAQVAAGALVPGLLVALYHWAAFGGPATLAYQFSTQPHRHTGWFMGLGVPEPRVIAELLWGQFRGLLPLMPWLVLCIPGAVRLWRARWRAEVGTALAIVLLYLWLNASLVDWNGGWAFGPRYLVPALPFMVWLCSGVFLPGLPLWPRRVIGGLTLAAVCFSGFLMLVATSVKPEVPVQIRRPLAGYLVPRFRQGQLMVSTQSIDMKGAPENAPAQAWSLGGKLGLGGKTQLLPLALWLLGCGAALAWSRRRPAG